MNQTYTDNPFHSFWMAGFECSDQLNKYGNRVNLLTETQHTEQLASDYQLIQQFGIKTVREGICWSQVEKIPYQYNFATVRLMIDGAIAQGIQQIWDICHFGYPDDLSPLHPHFTARFEGVCRAFAKFYQQEYPNLQLIVTPINEVSFISWLGGEAGGTTPYSVGIGWQVKYALMRAYIAGIKAMRAVHPTVRILTTEPIVNIVPPLDADDDTLAAALIAHEEQFQALDILSGRICPELGGSPDMLDLLGFNYYYNNQWVLGFEEFLPWMNDFEDERWLPLSKLLQDAYQRYNKPVVITETSHPGEHRPQWITFIGEECRKAIANGVPLYGVCLYPIIDRPDWDDLANWHHSGLWDHVVLPDGKSERCLVEDYAEALRTTQLELKEAMISSS